MGGGDAARASWSIFGRWYFFPWRSILRRIAICADLAEFVENALGLRSRADLSCSTPPRFFSSLRSFLRSALTPALRGRYSLCESVSMKRRARCSVLLVFTQRQQRKKKIVLLRLLALHHFFPFLLALAASLTLSAKTPWYLTRAFYLHHLDSAVIERYYFVEDKNKKGQEKS